MSGTRVVVADQELAEGKSLCATIEGRQITVIRRNGAYFAFDRFCPHKKTPLEQGPVENGVIYCPMHGWGFNLTTGACDQNPEKPLKLYPARVENGQVVIEFA
jgi:nitrite reductase/ring-hydroxylating ferredoxin subunit